MVSSIMAINIVIHNHTRVRVYGESFFRRIVDAAAVFLKTPRGHTAEVGIVLIGPARMRALNKRHRGKDQSTDVLSFPLSSSLIKGYTGISLGDLFISPSDVARKAVAGGRSVRQQMQWTVIHGLLHLAGYTHEHSRSNSRRMAAVEQKILKKL